MISFEKQISVSKSAIRCHYLHTRVHIIMKMEFLSKSFMWVNEVTSVGSLLFCLILSINMLQHVTRLVLFSTFLAWVFNFNFINSFRYLG